MSELTFKSAKLTAEQKQANYDRVYQTQVKQFCFQQATQRSLTDGSQTPKAPAMEEIIKDADLMWQWFSTGAVPATKSAVIHTLN